MAIIIQNVLQGNGYSVLYSFRICMSIVCSLVTGEIYMALDLGIPASNIK